MNELGNQLPEPHGDGITSVRFAPDQSNLLLSASWDCTVRIYDAARGTHQTTITQDAPILDATWLGNNHSIATASLDNHVYHIDISTGQPLAIGTHDAPVKCIEYLPSINLIATAGWDGYLHLWDPRTSYSSSTTNPSIKGIKLPGKAFSMSASESRLVVATSGRYVEVYNIQSLLQYHTSTSSVHNDENNANTLHNNNTTTSIEAEQHRESPLKYQTRCVRCFPDNTGFAISSTEGRVAMEYFADDPTTKSKQYAFKCHRKTIDGIDTIYPVNALAFHSVYGTFVTGGSDGVVNFWDGVHKKRLQQVKGYPTSIAALAFNYDGSLLAVASSYMFEKGEKGGDNDNGDNDNGGDAVYVRAVSDVEIRPRQRQQ